MAQEATFTKIPVINFSRFLNGSATERQEVADEIGDACRRAGFFYLSNHGISQDLQDRVFVESKKFFALPLEEKLKLKKAGPICFPGYIPMGSERISRLGDYKEVFNCLHELPADDEYYQKPGADLYGGNVWPENLPNFRRTIYDEYMTAMINLADKVMESYALALQLPADWFKPITRKPIVVGRLAYYPSFSSELSQDQLSCGAHTDDNGVTLLLQQEGVCGLQVKNERGEWIDAVPIPGTIVVNIGDLVERWSNGHFKATEHRVLMQPGVERYSVIVFHTPDYHATIECCAKGEKPKYPAIIAGDFIRNRGEAHSQPIENWVDNEQNLINAEEHSLKIRADIKQQE